jgi:RNA recognition motif-containing protein
MQKKAITEMNGKDLKGRKIVVKVAIDKTSEETNEPAGDIEAVYTGTLSD